MSEHLPGRPSWDCLACGKPWPCDPAREYLATTMPRTQLCLYAAARFGDALEDLPTAPVSELYDRFLSWIRY